MGLLEWRTEYSVGVAAVDDEHRELISLINVLYERMDARSSITEIESSLGDIYKAIAMHFALEERIMADAQYDELAQHKDDHEDLLDQLSELMDAFVQDPLEGSGRLEDELSAWFTHHFATHDARLHGRLGV